MNTDQELNRYEVVLTSGADEIHTFTWGLTYQEAYSRIAREMNSEVWEGYSFQVSR